MIASMSAVAGNLIINITLHPVYGYRILALGTAAAAVLNFGVLYVMFTRAVTSFRHGPLLAYVLRIAIAGAVMGVAVWGLHDVLDSAIGHISFGARVAVALIPVVAGAVVYAVACWLLRIEELSHYASRLRRR
jgi:putative peptidoglycan lipid II flippase